MRNTNQNTREAKVSKACGCLRGESINQEKEVIQMFRCPNCDSEHYHVLAGYGIFCDDCGYTEDREGGVSEDDNELCLV